MMVAYLSNPNPKIHPIRKGVPLSHTEKHHIEIHIWENYKISPSKHLSIISRMIWVIEFKIKYSMFKFIPYKFYT